MRKRSSEKGFTIIELLITIAISSIIGLGLVSLQYILSQNQIAINKGYKSVDDANYAATMIARELRRASSSETGSYPLSVAQDQNIIFYSDTNLDGDMEKIGYHIDGANLIKTVIEPTGFPVSYPDSGTKTTTISEIVRNGTDPIFYYYNGDYPADTTNNPLTGASRLSDTRSIRIYLVMSSNPNDTKSQYIIDSLVNIRMLKDNL